MRHMRTSKLMAHKQTELNPEILSHLKTKEKGREQGGESNLVSDHEEFKGKWSKDIYFQGHL